MKSTRNLVILSRALFFICVLFIVLFFADGLRGPFFLNQNFRALKCILCLLVPAATTLFNMKVEKSLKFLSNAIVIIMCFFVVGFFLCNLFGVPQFVISETCSIFHILYALVSIFTVFLTVTFVCSYDKKTNYGYDLFFKNFFIGYIPVLIMLYVLVYFDYRTGGTNYIINLIPFRGEIKTLFSQFSSFAILRTLGNIFYYSTVSLTAARFAKKRGALVGFFSAFLLSLLSEVFQVLFNMGDADIDDILLNSLGALIGALVYKFIIEKLRRQKICSE
ncbi:MAG: VanZ family protein [Eubacterium sp.]|nr:VanZ family protein [Eubacterium sp.]